MEARVLRPLRLPRPIYQGFTPFKAYRWRLLVTAGMVTALAGLAMARLTVLSYSALGEIVKQRATAARLHYEWKTIAAIPEAERDQRQRRLLQAYYNGRME